MSTPALILQPSEGTSGMHYGSLRGRDARYRHAERRAAHVVEARHVEEVDRVRVAAVLAADADLQIGLGLAARPRREPHEPAHARGVDRVERAAVDDLLVQVGGEE